MFFKPKKSREIYDLTIAHRGLHDIYPENSIKAYERAIENLYAIELDIRFTKDRQIVCFHDRHIRRLLKAKGKIKRLSYEDILKYYIKGSTERVPLLKDVLKLVAGKVPILIEVKGLLSPQFSRELESNLKHYNGIIYFHTENIITYRILRKKYKNKVFFVLNPLRKRFNFIKFK